MNSNIKQHVDWAKENSHIALDGFPAPRATLRDSAHANIDNIAYDFDGRTKLEAMQLESSSGAAANKQARTGTACLSAVGLQELQKCQAVRIARARRDFIASLDFSQRIVVILRGNICKSLNLFSQNHNFARFKFCHARAF